MMRRTNVYLDEEQVGLLRRLSLAEGRSVSDLMREALQDYLTRREAAAPRVLGPRRQIPRDEWQARFAAALERLRAGVPRDMTPEEIEDMITEASDEARRERLARCSVTETR